MTLTCAGSGSDRARRGVGPRQRACAGGGEAAGLRHRAPVRQPARLVSIWARSILFTHVQRTYPFAQTCLLGVTLLCADEHTVCLHTEQ